MDLERVKLKRTTIRELFTKLTTKIDNTLAKTIDETYTVENKTEDVYDLKNQLNEKLSELKELDISIENEIDTKDLKKEITASDKYRETGITAKTKLDRYLNSLEVNGNPEIIQSEIRRGDNESSSRNANNNQILKLPRLNISVFSGEFSEWLDFWNAFEVAIHKNDSLSKIEKFAYLKTYLKGTALSAVSGFALTNDNYDSSIQLLKQRFGRTDLIISSHMNKLLLIESVKTNSNIKALRKMYDAIELQVRSLQSLGVAAGTYSNLLCPVILQKLPDEINLQYNRQRKSGDDYFDINELMEFLRKEIHCRETSLLLANQNASGYENIKPKTMNNNSYSNFNKPRSYNSYSQPKKNNSTTSALLTTTGNKCIFCFDKTHENESCPLNAMERKKALISQGRCFLCLNRRHVIKNCWKKNSVVCKNCGLNHNTLICDLQTSKSCSSETQCESVKESSLFCNDRVREKRGNVFLQTFSALVESGSNKRTLIRCLLDGGSTRSFIERKIAESLNLKKIGSESLVIYPFGNKQSERKIYDIVEVVLKSRLNPNQKKKIKAVVIDNITCGHIEIPSPWVKHVAFERGIELADLGTTTEVDILIGSDYIWEILSERNIRLSNRLVATHSIFGFVIQGKENESNNKEVHVKHLTVIEDEMDYVRVKDLWELETIGINLKGDVSRTNEDILENFRQNTTYENKRYETRLLWKNEFPELNDNYEIARKRLFNLNNSFKQNENLYLNYRDIIDKQLKDDIIEEIDYYPNKTRQIGYFMPHHGVIRELKETTKLRICYDASSKAKGKISLNDCLESGPNLNPDLLKIILKFRYHQIAFCADIERAFLEIGILEEDRKFLRFLWGKDLGTDLDLGRDNIRILQFKRTPFGVKCSPFILAATLRLHIQKYQNVYPEACKHLYEFYVDDLISGCENIKNAFSISKDAIEILSEASMNLRQWETNSPILKKMWEEQGIDCKKTHEESGIELKVLGIVWDNKRDTIKVASEQFKQLNYDKFSKRNVLKACGMLFDPLGLLSPFTIRLKLLMQQLWQIGISWDEPLPTALEIEFREWLNEIVNVQEIEIPRRYFDDLNFENLELHLFSDASPRAYGAVAYFRIKYPEKIATRFVIAKSRVAPIKSITLPRLELLGALISARLLDYLLNIFPVLKESNIYLWCDSQISLHWIKGSAERLKQFVRNRVTEIKEKTNQSNWKYISGKENPADKLTRGVSSYSLLTDTVWLKGPAWLQMSELPFDTPQEMFDPKLEIEEKREVRDIQVLLQTSQELKNPLLDLNKYSDFHKMLRITSYVIRFVNNCRPNLEKLFGSISAKELENSEMYWIKFIQKTEFESEYLQLKKSTPISPNSRLYGLNPILTPDGLISLGGRLQNSEFKFLERHPWIIPGKCKFTEMLIMKEHKNLFHAGVSETLTQLREKYWILKGRQTVKSCLNKCMVCKRFKAKPGNQVTAPLPADRLHAENAFEIVGIDFAGPLYTKDTNKTYIALFTCAVTRAIHLELVSSLSTEHFLLAFRRFVSRRGICKTVYSDNALTFKSADAELKTLYNNILDPTVQNYFGKKGIEWKYIVERAAWWGGYWERMVRITKIALRKILGKALLSFEELLTVLTEIESIINSRPLTYVYNEPCEPFPLTPANFLTGKRLTSLPPTVSNTAHSLINKKKCLIKRFLYREKLLNNFWKRWKEEYLLQLKSAHFVKPVNNTTDFNINDVVLVGDDRMPRQTWKLAKILELHKGRDGKVRSATLKTESAVLKRPVQLLYNLELDKQ